MNTKKKIFFALCAFILIAHAQSNPIETEEVNPEEGDLFEGDIAGIDKGAAQKPTLSRVLWPQGVVPYEIDPVFSRKIKKNHFKKFKIFYLSSESHRYNFSRSQDA